MFIYNLELVPSKKYISLDYTKYKDIFSESFANGIGRGRAFGCGLLQIIPVSLSTEA